MGKINILPSDIISKIAAGEVIERPASVIKELLENALDAGTRSIDINIKDAGKTLIAIKDSGSGIARDDMEKVFFRHSTSKIHDISDLYNITSLGFRGEALYSIAAVSDVILRSKTKDQDSGWEIHVRGGKQLALKPVPMPDGTEIEVNELFFNTPARKKFMKTDSTEFGQMISTILPYSLIEPKIPFKVSHNGSAIVDLQKEETSVKRIARALRLNEENIIETFAKSDDGTVTIHLFLGDINIQRAKKDMQFIFVNNRPVQDKSINFHINNIYRLIFPEGVYPFFTAMLTIPPANIDVNTHPSKREIKIKDDNNITRLLRSLCENTLLSQGTTKKVRTSPFLMKDIVHDKPSYTTETERSKTDRSYQNSFSEKQYREPPKQYTLFRNTEGKAIEKRLKEKKTVTFRQKLEDAVFIGVFFKKYLIYGSGTSMLLIDQHAAQERVTYEMFVSQLAKGNVEVQPLLAPIIMKLSHNEMLVWERLKSHLKNIGFDTTMLDKEAIALHSHPQMITRPEISVRTILAEVDKGHVTNETLARWACRSSVMAGDTVTKEGSEYLRKSLIATKDPFTCPHGRPTLIELDDHFLEKQFLRI